LLNICCGGNGYHDCKFPSTSSNIFIKFSSLLSSNVVLGSVFFFQKEDGEDDDGDDDDDDDDEIFY